jgi:DNA-binding CsgD family transcriptional regulator/tetratricopeptide (TPR) repeat protein
MLETIREFGLEQLVASGEDQSVRDRHVAYFLALAEQAEQPSTSAARVRTNQKLGEELPNLRAALAWASAQQDAVHLLRLTNALYWLFYYRGLLDEANTWQAEAVAAMTAAAPATPVLRRLQMQALTKTANAARIRGDFDRAAGLLTEAAAIAREIDDPGATAEVEHGLGLLAIWRGDLEDAQPHLEVALAGWRALDKPGWIAATVNELGYWATLKGDWPNAERYFTEALDVARSSGGMEMEAKVLECLGTCARNQGDYRRAADRFAEALTLARDGSILYVTALCLKSLGVLAAHAGNVARAARLFGAWEALQERLGFADTGVLERTQIERTIAPSRAALSPEAFTAAWATGRKLPLADAVAEALDVARELMSGQPIGPDVRSRLSPREMDVLRLVVEGLSDKEIATSLGMSPRTASKHVETILNKFDVPSRTAAATYATRHGIT